MEGNIANFLDKFFPDIPPEIFNHESYLKLYKMVPLLKDFVTRDYILETCLDNNTRQVDFSFCIRAEEREFLARAFKEPHFQILAGDRVWNRVIGFVNSWSIENKELHKKIANVWFEMDSGEYEKDIPQPCLFFDATQVKNDTSMNNDWLFEALKKLLGSEPVELLRNEIKNVIKYLPSGTALFQVGTMLARKDDRVRICTSQLTMEQTVRYLKNIGWPEDLSKFNVMFALMNCFSNDKYVVNFDVTRKGVTERIGIEFSIKDSKVLPLFLNELTGRNLCTEHKRKGILSWKGSSCKFLGTDYGQTSLLRDISHFKASYLPGEGIRVKAYLRVLGVYLKELFKPKERIN